MACARHTPRCFGLRRSRRPSRPSCWPIACSRGRTSPSSISCSVALPSPTIAAVLAAFLAEQQQRLSPKTFAQYEDVVELLQHSLNGYAYLTLSGRDAQRFDQRFNAPGVAHREFCELFGPEHILPNVG